jgi:hypothetical protein
MRLFFLAGKNGGKIMVPIGFVICLGATVSGGIVSSISDNVLSKVTSAVNPGGRLNITGYFFA